MTTQPQPMDRLMELFSTQKCWMIADLSQSLGYSIISVRRFLNQLGYFRSYSHNGKWYTPLDCPIFNKEGIWIYDDIGFSKHGNLLQTITYLISKSPEGLSARDLTDKLYHPCHAVLTNMYKQKQIDRVKFTNEFTYLSTDKKIYRRQCNRLKAHVTKEPVQTLSSEAAVFVLVEFVKYPQLSFEQMAENLQKHRHITVLPESISRFFQEHDLKKTADS